jgi:starch synthase
MVTAEAAPFAQTGGLGEVLSALPAALVDLGADVDVLLPRYRGIDGAEHGLQELEFGLEIDLNANKVQAGLWHLRDERGVRYIFLNNDHYYDRDGLYGTPLGDYEDNSERFVFLSRAAIEMALAARTQYDVFHVHDWQAALTAVYLRTLFVGEDLLTRSASILTIHNLGYQGIFWSQDMSLVGLGWEYFNHRHMEFYGNLNFLKSGIVFADAVNTVSPGYRNEILTPEFGFGLEGVLQEKGDRLTGILNGVDYTVWNPARDDLIPARFNTDDLSGKRMCKTCFQQETALPVAPDTPLLAMVGRLSGQKGVDILQGALPYLLSRDAQIVLLGTGEARYHGALLDLAQVYPDQMRVFLTYDQDLAHRIFAAADILLVPSRYEPCGLTQLYALKYGTVPVVRSTGGLEDTVEQYRPDERTGTGFKFWDPRPAALEQACATALDLFARHPDQWRELQIRGMREDFSWRRSARDYHELYQRALRTRVEP